VRVDGTWRTDFRNGKLHIDRLKPGDAVRLRSGGGGGYGPPWERAIASVQHDVKQGYVTPEAAAEAYGVAIAPVTLEVDFAATERLRSALRKDAQADESAAGIPART